LRDWLFSGEMPLLDEFDLDAQFLE